MIYRIKTLIDTHFVRLTKTREQYQVCGIALFNALPSEARLIAVKRFRFVLYKELIKRAFYTVHEFLKKDMD